MTDASAPRRDLRMHLSKLYGQATYQTCIIEYRYSIEKALEAERHEQATMYVNLRATKRETLEYLHDSLHTKLRTTCLPDGDDWYSTLITEHSSLEDVMAAAKATSKQNTIKAEIRYVPEAEIGKIWAKAQMGDADGFLDPDKMDLVDAPGFVAQRRAANHPRNLETIYNYYQKIDGAPEERTEQLKVRSMTTGDAIVLDGVAYYVTAKGFVTKAADGTITAVEAPEA